MVMTGGWFVVLPTLYMASLEWFFVEPGSLRASNRRGSCSLSRNCDKETIHTSTRGVLLACYWRLGTPSTPFVKYPLVNLHSYRKSPSLKGKSTINGPFSIAMLNYQRVMSGYDSDRFILVLGLLWAVFR